MALLKFSRFALEAHYVDIEDSFGITDYTYSFRLFLGNHPLFSSGVEKDYLAEGGLIIATSDEEDILLKICKEIVAPETPLGTSRYYYSEVDSPQQIMISLRKEQMKRCPGLVIYPIEVETGCETFKHLHGIGDIILKTHEFEPDFLKAFISELEQEKALLIKKKQNNGNDI